MNFERNIQLKHDSPRKQEGAGRPASSCHYRGRFSSLNSSAMILFSSVLLVLGTFSPSALAQAKETLSAIDVQPLTTALQDVGRACETGVYAARNAIGSLGGGPSQPIMRTILMR